jgi:hypothetical protein
MVRFLPLALTYPLRKMSLLKNCGRGITITVDSKKVPATGRPGWSAIRRRGFQRNRNRLSLRGTKSRVSRDPQSRKTRVFKNQQWSIKQTIEANLATVHGGDQSEMYATDRRPETMRRCVGWIPRFAGRATIVGARRAVPFGRAASKSRLHTRMPVRNTPVCLKTIAKFPRSLPESAPGIPSSARDHSLALGQINLSRFNTCAFFFVARA